jgi:hypothetical protein
MPGLIQRGPAQPVPRRPGVVHQIEPRWPTLAEPLMHPCQAGGIGAGAQACGATPASLWRRYCRWGHSRRVRLCGSHALLITLGRGACSECVARGAGDVPAQLEAVDLLMAGHAGTGA